MSSGGSGIETCSGISEASIAGSAGVSPVASVGHRVLLRRTPPEPKRGPAGAAGAERTAFALRDRTSAKPANVNAASEAASAAIHKVSASELAGEAFGSAAGACAG